MALSVDGADVSVRKFAGANISATWGPLTLHYARLSGHITIATAADQLIAAVGADNPHKSELHPELMARATVVPDVLDQAVYMGDLHHAMDAGVMTREDVRAELGTLISGAGPGRARSDDITIFDSTGTGIQDVAAAARAYEVALTRQGGSRIELA